MRSPTCRAWRWGSARSSADGPRQVRTGVTAIVPPFDRERSRRPPGPAYYALNGNGEMTGTHWIEDAGWFCGPILITNTHSVGIVHHAAVRWMIRRYRRDFDDLHLWAMPVVAETYDGVLSRHLWPACRRRRMRCAALDGATRRARWPRATSAAAPA